MAAGTKTEKEQRDARRADALRDNLHRRKNQARARNTKTNSK